VSGTSLDGLDALLLEVQGSDPANLAWKVRGFRTETYSAEDRDRIARTISEGGGVKHNGDWFDEKSFPSVPYIVNLLMDPLEKVTPDAKGYEYAGRKFVAQKLWAPTAAGPFLAAHLKSLAEFPPSQGADTLSMRKAIEQAMKKLDNPRGSSN
jgi:hypothetical protein